MQSAFHIAFTWWLGHFISRYLKVHFILIKYTGDSKSQTLRMRYPFQSTGRPISHRNRLSFRVYMIPLWDFVPEWDFPPRYKNRGELMPGWLTLAWHFAVVSCKPNYIEPWEGTGVNSLHGESRPSVMYNVTPPYPTDLDIPCSGLFSPHIKFYSLILLHKISIRQFCVNSKHPRLTKVREMSTEIPYWSRVTTQIGVLLLIGWSKFHKRHDQPEAVPDLGSDSSSVRNFCARFSGDISAGNQWWHRKMLAVFSGSRGEWWRMQPPSVPPFFLSPPAHAF